MPPDELKLQLSEMSPLSWLLQYDSRPHVLPTWPLSERLTLVAVVVTDYDTDAESEGDAFVVTTPEILEQLVDLKRSTTEAVALFFTVPRSIVLPYCPSMTADSWST